MFSCSFKPHVLFLLFILPALVSAQIEYEWDQDTCTNTPLEVPISVVQHTTESSTYQLEWKSIEANKPGRRRPLKEIHCVVRDNSGIIAHYEGGDSIMSHCSFQTNQQTVSVEFSIKYYQIGVDPRLQCRYEPIKLNLPDSKDKQISKTVRVMPDQDIYVFRCPDQNYSSKYIDAFLLGPKASYINIEDFYLNKRKRRILSADDWLKKLSFCTLKNRHGFVRIDPHYYYKDKQNNTYLGSELIQLKELPKSFDLKSHQFKKDYNNRLYYKSKKGA